MARDYNRDGLNAAARVLANAMQMIARVKTRTTADAVNISYEDDEIAVRAGRPGGAYGWEPVQAFMFDENARHPLFGNKRHWYHQGRYPIIQLTEESASDSAAHAYCKAAIDPLLADHGYK